MVLSKAQKNMGWKTFFHKRFQQKFLNYNLVKILLDILIFQYSFYFHH